MILLLYSSVFLSALTRSWCFSVDNSRPIKSETVLQAQREQVTAEFQRLTPLPSLGTYYTSLQDKMPCGFLGPDAMICSPRDDGTCIASGIIPVPVPESSESALYAAMQTNDKAASLSQLTWSGQSLFASGSGVVENLGILDENWVLPSKNREFCEYLRRKSTYLSAYHCLLSGIEQCLQLQVVGLVLELADYSDTSDYEDLQFFRMGAALLVTRSGAQQLGGTLRNYDSMDGKLSQARDSSSWVLSSTSADSNSEVRLVVCTGDELLGLAFASQLPVLMPRPLYNTAQIAASWRSPLTLTASW